MNCSAVAQGLGVNDGAASVNCVDSDYTTRRDRMCPSRTPPLRGLSVLWWRLFIAGPDTPILRIAAVTIREALRAIVALSGGQGETHRAPKASNGHVDLGAQATTRTTKGLIWRPPF